MRDSTYRILEAVNKEPKSWSELIEDTGLTDPGLFKALKEMKRHGMIVQVAGKSPSGAATKRYALSPKATDLKIFQAAKLLKRKLEKLSI